MSQSLDPSYPYRPCPRVVAYPPKPRRHRPVNPYAAANELAMQHQDIADKVAGNISRRTGHSVEDLKQIAMMGVIQASRRYLPERGGFRAFARTYANGEVYHYLRDKGFLLKVPASWREAYSRGGRLLRDGKEEEEVLRILGLNRSKWGQIVDACQQRVISMTDCISFSQDFA